MRTPQLSYLTVLLAFVFSAGAQAQSNHQVLLDTAGVDVVPLVLGATTMSTGDHVLSIRTASGIHLVRTDVDGTPVWNRKFGSTVLEGQPTTFPSAFLFPKADGHVIHVYCESTEAQNIDIEPDTSVYTFGISSIAPDGSLDWHSHVTGSSPNSTQLYTPSLVMLDACMDQAGNIFIFTEAYAGIQTDGLVIKVDALGNGVWGRNLNTNALFHVAYGRRLTVTPDNAGGCFLCAGHLEGAAIDVGHMGADGTVGWLKSFNYLNSVVGSDGTNAILTSAGELLLGARFAVPGHAYSYMLAVSPDGIILGGDLYEPGWLMELTEQADGSILARSDSTYFVLDPDGALLDQIKVLNTASGGSNYTLQPISLKSVNGKVQVVGDLKSVDDTFGYTTFKPALWSFNFDPLGGCALEVPQLTHIEIPEALLGSTDEPYTMTDLLMSTEFDALSVEDLPLWPTIEACSVIAAVHETAASEAFALMNTIASTSEPLLIQASEPLRLEFHDALGALVDRGRSTITAGRTTVPIDGLATGPYVITARSVSGALLGSARVVIVAD